MFYTVAIYLHISLKHLQSDDSYERESHYAYNIASYFHFQYTAHYLEVLNPIPDHSMHYGNIVVLLMDNPKICKQHLNLPIPSHHHRQFSTGSHDIVPITIDEKQSHTHRS